MKKRIFDYNDLQIKDAVKGFLELNKERKVLNADAFKEDPEKGIDFIKDIEDLAEALYNGGFDANTQKKMSLADLSEKIETMSRDYNESVGKQVIRDFSATSLGFFAQQVINRLVTKIETQELEAWQFISRDLVLEDATVFYTIVIGENGSPATTRVAEGGEFKTINLESTEDYIKTSKGKIGVFVTLTEEAIKRNGAALITSLCNAAINDIKRYKSLEAVRLIEANGRTVLDGLDPTKKPSGVSFKDPSVANGTLLLKDLENFFFETQHSGYDVDTIFIHPLAWKVFFAEPNIKKYLKETANIWFMIPKKMPTIAQNQLTKWSKVHGPILEKEEHLSVPQLITNKSLNVIVTPLVSFFKKGSVITTPGTRFTPKPTQQHASAPTDVTDIILCDSSRCLTHVHDGKGIMSDKIEDKLVDVTKIKFKNYYNFILDKDHGVFAFRNITVTDDVFDPYNENRVVSVEHGKKLFN